MKTILILLCLAEAAFGQANNRDLQIERERWTFDKPSQGIPIWPEAVDAANQITREQILAFLQAVDLRFIGVKDVEDIETFRFVPLERDKLYLVAAVSTGGSLPFPEIDAIFCTAESCTADNLALEQPPIDLAAALVSIKDDGIYQFVAKDSMSTVSKEWWSPWTYIIYEMGPKGPHDASAKYRGWYTEHLYPELERQLKGGPPIEFIDAKEIACYHAGAQYAIDDYRERVLGVKGALLQHALEWANSPYWSVHLLALSAVEGAPDSPRATKVFDALEKSSSEQIRQMTLDVRKDREERAAEKEIKQQ